MKQVRKTYHLNPDNVEKVKKHSEKTGLKISAIVNQALEKYFKNKK